jgi:hypothetical protein
MKDDGIDARILASVLEQVGNAFELVKLLEPSRQPAAIEEIGLLLLRLEEDMKR